MNLLSNIELVMWNLNVREHPTVEGIREALREHKLNPDRAADIPTGTAFRRAVESLRDKQENIVSRCWSRNKDGSKVRAQFDHEYEEETGRLQRKLLCLWDLVESGPQLVAGIANDLPTAFGKASITYTGGDITSVLQQILKRDGLGAYSPRKAGGIYFVPIKPDAKDLLDRIESFCSDFGVRFLRYRVPDTGTQRDEIAEAIAEAIKGELDQHEAAIAGYNGETKLGHINNRHEALNETERLIGQLVSLLGGRDLGLKEKLASLRDLLEQTRRLVETARTEQRAAGPARRIVGVAR